MLIHCTIMNKECTCTCKSKLNDIHNDIKQIQKDLCSIKSSCDTMNTHISFVDSVYERIKSPLYYMLSAGRVDSTKKIMPNKTELSFENENKIE